MTSTDVSYHRPGSTAVLDPVATAVDRAAAQRPDDAGFIAGYFRHVPPDDQPQSVADVLAIIDGHRRVGARRARGQALVSAVNPPHATGAATGWADTATVVDIVTDDMPHLVESVIGALVGAGCTVHRVLHPILICRRSFNGDLVAASDARSIREGSGRVERESWLHILIDRVSDAVRTETIPAILGNALTDVRAVVQDSGAIIGAATAAAAALRSNVSPLSATEATEAADFLYWMTSGHSTLLGYQRYDRAADRAGKLGPAAGSGLGILRNPSITEPAAGDPVLESPGALMSLVPGLLCGIEARNARQFFQTLRSAGAPDDIASRVAHSLYGFGLLNIVDIAAQSGRDLIECAGLYYAVSAHLGFDRLLFAVTTLERETRWHALARQAARDDLYQSLKLITTDVLSISTPGQDRFAAIDCWERPNSARLIRARKALGELAALPEGDLAVVSVVAREVRSMIR